MTGQKLLSYEVLLKKQKVEIPIFDRANPSGFATSKFTAKKDLNPRKQVFLLHLRL